MTTEPQRDTFLLASGNCEKANLLTDEQFLSDTLENIVELLGMHQIQSPSVCSATNNPGLEGYVPIDTSNITISTYSNESKFVMCVHSCKQFSFHSVLAYLQNVFGSAQLSYQYCDESDFEVFT